MVGDATFHAKRRRLRTNYLPSVSFGSAWTEGAASTIVSVVRASAAAPRVALMRVSR